MGFSVQKRGSKSRREHLMQLLRGEKSPTRTLIRCPPSPNNRIGSSPQGESSGETSAKSTGSLDCCPYFQTLTLIWRFNHAVVQPTCLSNVLGHIVMPYGFVYNVGCLLYHAPRGEIHPYPLDFPKGPGNLVLPTGLDPQRGHRILEVASRLGEGPTSTHLHFAPFCPLWSIVMSSLFVPKVEHFPPSSFISLDMYCKQPRVIS